MRIFTTSLFSILLTTCFGQGILSDDAYCFSLLKSGVKEVSVYKDNALYEIWDFDSIALTCTKKRVAKNRTSNYLLPDYKKLAVSFII